MLLLFIIIFIYASITLYIVCILCIISFAIWLHVALSNDVFRSAYQSRVALHSVACQAATLPATLYITRCISLYNAVDDAFAALPVCHCSYCCLSFFIPLSYYGSLYRRLSLLISLSVTLCIAACQS